MIFCPVCGGSLPARPDPVGLVATANLRGHARRVAVFLAARFGQHVPTDFLIDRMYADSADGGPINARSVLTQTTLRVRRRLRPYGITIAATQDRWNGGTTVMRWIEPSEGVQNAGH